MNRFTKLIAVVLVLVGCETLFGANKITFDPNGVLEIDGKSVPVQKHGVTALSPAEEQPGTQKRPRPVGANRDLARPARGGSAGLQQSTATSGGNATRGGAGHET